MVLSLFAFRLIPCLLLCFTSQPAPTGCFLGSSWARLVERLSGTGKVEEGKSQRIYFFCSLSALGTMYSSRSVCSQAQSPVGNQPWTLAVSPPLFSLVKSVMASCHCWNLDSSQCCHHLCNRFLLSNSLLQVMSVVSGFLVGLSTFIHLIFSLGL